MTKNFSTTIHNQTFKREFVYDSTSLMQLTVEDFQVFSPNFYADRTINDAIKTQSSVFKDYVTYDIFALAIENYNQSIANDYPFHAYDAIKKYNVTYNQNCTLSFYSDEYLYTGGAHGTTTRRSSTFSLTNGKTLPLGHYFCGGNYIRQILDEIIMQAQTKEKEQPGMFFENYEKLIVKYFNICSFYLTEEGIVIYYQQYDIAPYSSGIIEFLIPYSENKTPSCV